MRASRATPLRAPDSCEHKIQHQIHRCTRNYPPPPPPTHHYFEATHPARRDRTVDDDGVPCAGFRQCGSITGLTGLNPAAHKWDGETDRSARTSTPTRVHKHKHRLDSHKLGRHGSAPLELRCAKNDNLTDWGEPEYIFPVYYCEREHLRLLSVVPISNQCLLFRRPLKKPLIADRGLPYDPTRPWKDNDGKWYATISVDGW